MNLRSPRHRWLYIVKEYTSAKPAPYRIHHFRNTRTTNGMVQFVDELHERFHHTLTIRPPDIGAYIIEDGKARHVSGDNLIDNDLIPLPEPGLFAVNRSTAERQAVYSLA